MPRAALVLDVVAMALVAVTALALRFGFGWFASALDVGRPIGLVTPLILLGWVAIIAALGGYRERLFGAGIEEYKIVLNASLLAAGLTAVASYLTNFELSRGFYLLTFILGPVVLVLQRALLRRALHRARRAGTACHDVIIAGAPANVDEISRVLSRESWLGYRVHGAIVPASYAAVETASGVPVLGTTDDAIEVLTEANADIVFVAGGALDGPDQMRELVYDLEHRQIQVIVAPSVTDVARERIRVRPVGGLPLVHIDPPRHTLAARRAKRVFDVAVTSAILLLAAPTMLAIATWVKLHDRGPVFFRQTRTGRHGEEFSCLKFRTMVTDAEARLARLQAEQGFEGGLFKMKDDPRITSPGKLLRRLSLDELPQLLNVLRGDMSLVGPRPPLPSEVATYDRLTQRRLKVRPGLTGLWQVSGRSDLTWEESVRLDLYYVDNWSMLQDLTILSRTAGAVLASRGAY
ncbi:exopolysaccharide biosynthesis polyprenyl glycosylphosphotransferase [Nocardioides sp. YIM 123512]|uniref:Exopolysaccharide biosynthesis polyprenyl glycosylphosphotransferase n=1 Tax=Nocardioides flavescens TaxID=2691959 RepID=A0A6L7ETD2_9ACTN|nr:exopolysaccharide biosynthesis polyprenyl glycosylphosphotransferase [Nocardioides flavescens]